MEVLEKKKKLSFKQQRIIKKNLEVFEKMCRHIDTLSEENKANYYLIQEYDNLTPMNQQQFDVQKDDFICPECDWQDHFSKRKHKGKKEVCPECESDVEKFIHSEFFRLVYTKKYTNPVLTFEDAKEAAEDKAKKNGGIWHAVKVDGIFTEVHAFYFNTHPNVESLYKCGEGDLSMEYLRSLGMNREQRRAFFKKNS